MLVNLLFISCALFMLAVGYLAGKNQDDEGYNIYNRKLPKLAYIVSFAATNIGAGFFITGTAYSYKYGLGLLWMFIGGGIGLIIFGYFSKWLRETTLENKLYSLPDYLNLRFGNLASIILGIITLLLLICNIAVQLVGGGKILESLGIFSYETSIVVSVCLVAIYLILSGYRAVIWTDYILVSAICILTCILASFSIFYFDPAPEAIKRHDHTL